VLEHTAQVRPPKYSRNVALNYKIIHKIIYYYNAASFPNFNHFLSDVRHFFNATVIYSGSSSALINNTSFFYCKNEGFFYADILRAYPPLPAQSL